MLMLDYARIRHFVRSIVDDGVALKIAFVQNLSSEFESAVFEIAQTAVG